MSYLTYLSFYSYSFRVWGLRNRFNVWVWGLHFRFALPYSGVTELTLVRFSMEILVFYTAARYIGSAAHHRFSESYINVPLISTLVGVNNKIFGGRDYFNTFSQMGAL